MRKLLRDENLVKPIADINMTNLVDVTLTLLILFILIAPVIDEGFTLPSAGSENIRTVDALALVINKSGEISLEGRKTTLNSLSAAVLEKADKREGSDIIILADSNLDYGFIIKVMDVLRETGITNISLATSEGGK